jgi:hypothetical protein
MNRRNQLCFCGSGQKEKNCCGLPTVGPVTVETIRAAEKQAKYYNRKYELITRNPPVPVSPCETTGDNRLTSSPLSVISLPAESEGARG